MHKVRRQMSNIGRATSVMQVQINEENSRISKGLPSEEDVKKVSESIERDDPKRIKLIREKLQKDVKRSFKETMMYIFRAQAIYVLLPAVPIAIIVGALGLSPGIVFGVNCFAIIPLAAVLSFATEELGFHAGEALSGFLNATFGNAVELIVSLFALYRGEIRIVQASMLGSILSNLLLVLGCCFVWGGSKHKEQDFNGTIANTMSSLLAVSSASLILPAVLYMTYPSGDKKTDAMPMIVDLSRYTSIVLCLLYVLYLYFSLYTHHEFLETKYKQVVRLNGNNTGEFTVETVETQQDEDESDEHWEEVWVTTEQGKRFLEIGGKYVEEEMAAEEGAVGNGSVAQNGSASNSRTPLLPKPADSANETMRKMKIPARHLTVTQSIIMLTIATGVVSICADYLVGAIEPFVEHSAWFTKTFIGLIIIPIVGNAAEHFTAVIAAGKNKMDLAVGVAVGSSLQIALGLTPLLVLIGWAMNQQMSLYFRPFETVILFVSVLIANYLIQDGKSNYLEGAMLIGTYVIVCICFLVIPEDGTVVTMLLNMVS